MGVIQFQFQKFKLKGSISEASLNRGTTTLNRVYYFYYAGGYYYLLLPKYEIRMGLLQISGAMLE